jgi:archaeal cell division control protein 6
MSVFDSMLKEGESLFSNELALDFSFQPKLLLHREKEQFQIAHAIRPLFAERTGKNILLHGRPGIGKTLAVKHVFRELDEQHEGVEPLYVNCWQHNSTYKVVVALCEAVGYRFWQNKKTHEIFKELEQRLNKMSVAFCFDEVDKLDDFDFLYTLLESVYRKSIILISNYKQWYVDLDERVRSRLHPELLEFRDYTGQEIQDILKQREGFAFKPGVMRQDAFASIVQHTIGMKDVRAGLHMMRLSAEKAEEKASQKITLGHVKEVLSSGGELYVKDMDLDAECQRILEVVKVHTGKKMGDLFQEYKDAGGKQSYKTFTRKMQTLNSAGFVSLRKKTGVGGNITEVHYQTIKKLTEF